MAAFGFCLVVSAVKLLDIYQVNEQAATDRQQETRMSEQYARLQTSFPRTPTSTEDLRAIVKNYRTLLRQSAFPGGMLVEISEAVAALPQIEIEKIDWEIGSGAKTPAGREAAKAAPAPSAPTEPAGAEFQVQTAEISGKLILPQASDYRAVAALVNEFTEALRRRCAGGPARK